MILKCGKHWCLFSHNGRLLGEHTTQHAARAQEYAIALSKARRAGHRIVHRRARSFHGAGWHRYGRRRRRR